MLLSYLRVAIRNLLKRKGYSLINIVGLSAGLAAVVLILLYAQHELTYDRFHADGERIFQIYKERITPTGTQITRDTWIPLADRLENEYPSVRKAVRMWDESAWIRYEEKRSEEQVTYADPGIFEMFSFPFVEGDPSTVLDHPTAAVVSTQFAARFFGLQDPIGKTIRVNNEVAYTITGVLAEIPSNSTLDINIALPVTSAPGYADMAAEWGGSFLDTYVLLDDAGEAAALEAQFPALIRSIWDDEVASRTNFKLEPLYELYDALTGNRQYSYILLGVAFVILLIAAINFMNLATARSLERAREIGMRKVLGARQRQLVFQFIGESTIISLVSLGLALLLVRGSLPFFNDLYDIELSLSMMEHPFIPVALIVLGLLVGILAGSYPAFHVSKFDPVRALRGASASSAGGIRLRSTLVVAQFTLAIALIALTLIMRNQLQFLQTAELKFDSEGVMVISVEAADYDDPDAAATRINTFSEMLREIPDIVSVSAASHAPGQWSGWFTFARPQGWGEQDPLRMRLAYVDANYFETYDLPLLEGRPFDMERVADIDESVIINEAALRSFGWQTAAGKFVRRGDTEYQVVGVVRDYHFDALRDEIAPILHYFRPADNQVHNFLAVRIRPGSAQSVIAAATEAWRHVDSDRGLPYEFADRTFARLYEQEARLISVTEAFTILAILIACLGLLGLASWSVTQRVREVGIRKVLGATAASIVMLLSREFLRLVAIALVVAIPLAYFAAGRWLEDFAYRIDLQPWTFALAGATALLIAFLTVSVMGLRAALTDPVNTLRSE